MFKFFAVVFAAVLAVAFAEPAPKPGVVAYNYGTPLAYSSYSSPLAYTGYSAPLAYSAGPSVVSGYAAPLAYSAYAGHPTVVY